MEKQYAPEAPTPVLSFDFPLRVEVYLPEFEPLESVSALDLRRLASGDHRVEFGFLRGGCGKEPLFAVIRDGKVVAVEAGPCTRSEEETSDEVAALLKQVVAELGPPGEFEPVPVDQFVAMVQGGEYPPRAGTGAGCFYLCLWKYCLFCCLSTATSPLPTCWIERRKPDVIMGV